MTILTTLTAGTNTGPFDLYQNSNGYVTPFATGVPRLDLVSGYNSIVDDATTVVRVKSTGICDTQVDIGISGIPGTTTTTSTSTTSTTTTIAPTITLSFHPFDKSFTLYATVPVTETVYLSSAEAVDGYSSGTCVGAIAGATLTGYTLGLNVGGTVDSAPAFDYTGTWGTSTPYGFSIPLIGLEIGGVNNSYADGDIATIGGVPYTVYISQTCP